VKPMKTDPVTRAGGLAIHIPASFTWATFAAPELPARVMDRSAIAAVQAKVDEGASFVLTGTSGSGKTTLAVCALHEHARRGRHCFFASEYDIGFGWGPALAARAVEVALRCDVLVVDDLGWRDSSYGSVATYVLAQRRERERPTIVIPTPYGRRNDSRDLDPQLEWYLRDAVKVSCGTGRWRSALENAN